MNLLLEHTNPTQSSNTVLEVVVKNTVLLVSDVAHGKPSFGTECICCLLLTFGWALACGQCLVLTAHSCRSRPPQVAAVQPVIADIRASYSIMSAGTSVCGQCGS